jgi:hypothetical protein
MPMTDASMAKALTSAGKALDSMIAKMIELKALPVAMVIANEGRLYSVHPEGVPMPSLAEWIAVYPGNRK